MGSNRSYIMMPLTISMGTTMTQHNHHSRISSNGRGIMAEMVVSCGGIMADKSVNCGGYVSLKSVDL